MEVVHWIESFIRAFMCLLGILGNNWLAIRSLPGKKSHLRTNEALFINLAASNLITNYMVDLPDTMADFANRWFLGRFYCGVFRFCSDLSETSSIFSTLLISVFWHQKLVGSLTRGTAPVQMDNLRLVTTLLVCGWTFAMIFSIPHFFFVSLETGNQSSGDCIEEFPSAVARQTYEVMYLTLANAVPIAGIVFASIQIVITLLRHQKRIKGMNSDIHNSIANPLPHRDETTESTVTNLPDHAESRVQQPLEAPVLRPTKATSGPSNQVRAAKSVVAVATVFLVCWLTHLLLRITSNVNMSHVVVEVASYIAASYTCIIPYIFLHGVKKLSCSCRG
ncbi:alpha-1B adrenergic receptor [Megalops cyprinoides]|uniref:alpha-1B adrenergic receptor n=1 Tax=Megalops cyprinoides TaxID=118141 RepID=UPI001863DD75|nr:alpha-1B adrenergic receptor [Megalops cyprinoides]